MDTSKIKIIFFGSSEFSIPILKTLIEDYDVVAVVTQADKPVGRKKIMTPTPVADFVFNNYSEIRLLKPETLKDDSIVQELKKLNADLFIVAAYGKIIPSAILSIPKKGCVNVHGSILPKYRGASPIHSALINGDEFTGNTIMRMDEEMDHGSMLSASRVEIDDTDDFKSLEKKMSEDGARILADTLPRYLDGSLKPEEQDHIQATYTKLIVREDGKIDWKLSAREILNRWRAYKYWPGIFCDLTLHDGKELQIKLNDVYLIDEATEALPGSFVIKDNNLIFSTANGQIGVRQLTPSGGKQMSAKDFINGYLKKTQLIG